jgi:hypothetical protein
VSWDLFLVPAEAAKDPGTWLSEAAERGSVDEAAARRHAEALRARRPELELFGPDEYGYELTAPEGSPFPIEIGLHGDHASLSVAYWELGDRTPELGDLVVELVTALGEETGWVPFDPQSDRVVGVDELRAEFESEHAYGVGVVAATAADAPKPKRKRFFGLF